MRSRLCFFFPFGHSGVLVNARGNIDRILSNSPAQLEIKDTTNEVKYMWMSFITCESIHLGGLVMTREEDKRFLCVWLLYYM